MKTGACLVFVTPQCPSEQISQGYNSVADTLIVGQYKKNVCQVFADSISKEGVNTLTTPIFDRLFFSPGVIILFER